MADDVEVDLDGIISRLLEGLKNTPSHPHTLTHTPITPSHPPSSHTPSARGTRTIKTVQLAENEVRTLCMKAREIFLGQPILLELEAPLKICGECATVFVCAHIANWGSHSRCSTLIAFYVVQMLFASVRGWIVCA